jgi:hypothetical protein
MTLNDRVGFNRLNLTRNATAPGQRDLPTGSTDYVPVPVRWFLSATYRHGEYIGKPNGPPISDIVGPRPIGRHLPLVKQPAVSIGEENFDPSVLILDLAIASADEATTVNVV